jgi:hypothetical protein
MTETTLETLNSHVVKMNDVQYYTPFAYHVYETKEVMARRARNQGFAKSVNSPDFAYSRSRNFGVTAYLRNKASPTGVLADGTAWDLKDAAFILDCKGKAFPLSPTEGLNKSGAVSSY